MWAKVYVTLTNKQDVGKWMARIRRYRERTQSLMDISIQDQRDLSLYQPLNAGAEPYRQFKTQQFIAQLNDLVSLIMELHSTASRCVCRSFRLAMPPNFVAIIDQLQGGSARELASSYLNRIFCLDQQFLESLELENIGWISTFSYSQLPPIFRIPHRSLKTLRLYNCFTPKLLYPSNPYELQLEHCFHWNSLRRQWEPVGQINGSHDLEMRICTDLQKLTIGPLTKYLVPLYTPSLHTLEIIAWWGHESTVLSHITNLSLENLHTLIISWPDTPFTPQIPISMQPEHIKNGTTALFTKAKRIMNIEAPRTVLISILRFLYERNYHSGPPTDTPKQLTLYEHPHKLQISLTGDESMEQLEVIALRHFFVSLVQPSW
ncbi:hypothetical protein PIIN_09830 [Serendipita indica DSM 11827]|uniref:Uncharacterized protein n=1 Tax=Serendipita indica (strain DSM 11827) TaxID=1109443 RepID=G4TWZ9_SERID|nr:hypothetical protein PIIN_09830 [Serendipita indica DSM 11827]